MEIFEERVSAKRFRQAFDLDHRCALALLIKILCWVSFALKPMAYGQKMFARFAREYSSR